MSSSQRPEPPGSQSEISVGRGGYCMLKGGVCQIGYFPRYLLISGRLQDKPARGL